MSNEFSDLVKSSGLKHEKVAKILRVSKDTVNSYTCGRLQAPARAIRILWEINKQLIKAGNDEEQKG